MAERRMFAKAIIDSDAFLDMPLSTQALYFHLAMRADDEGFVGNPKRVQKMINASDDDIRILIAKRYILAFDTGIIVIKHWKIHNYIQTDRFKETTYIEEKSQLMLDKKKSYTECIQDVSKMDTQYSIEITSIGKLEDNCIPTKLQPSSNQVSIDKEKDNIYSVVDYLNSQLGTKFKYTNKSTQSHIKARFSEGYTLDDFKTVIEKKIAEWRGTEMEKYLRPETLFGSKFEGYLNAKTITKKIDVSKYDREE